MSDLSCNCPVRHEFGDPCAIYEHRQAFRSRHLNEPIKGIELYKEPYTKEKIKTLSVALVMCLNVDVDPPDVQKIPPFSRVQAWFDPTDASNDRALETIGKNLQLQYERWQSKARYKQCLDPTLDDVKKLCTSLRRNAKDDRILFHYNGHGVPRPTDNGEIWVFNKTFTKYIPLSLYDLQRWLGGPSVYVIDCQNAGRFIKQYDIFCQQRKAEMMTAQEIGTNRDVCSKAGIAGESDNSLRAPDQSGAVNAAPGNLRPAFGSAPAPTLSTITMENTIMLAACQEHEDLPQHPDLPADLFTACLTTPIRTALKWHWLQYREHFPGYISEELLDRIPGSHSNRMSLLGEINWIFAAVTDTIAWCSFTGDVFQKLFRQDLLVASLFRNFLFAERVMRMYGCHPCSWPILKSTHEHPMWSAWDHSLDQLFQYLPRALRALEANPHAELSLPIVVGTANVGRPGYDDFLVEVSDTPSHLQELTEASNCQLTQLIGQVAKMNRTVSSSTVGKETFTPPGHVGKRRQHHQHQQHTIPDRTPQINPPLQKTVEPRPPVNAQSTRSVDPLTPRPSAAPPLGIQLVGSGSRPKFVIEPSSSSSGEPAVTANKHQLLPAALTTAVTITTSSVNGGHLARISEEMSASEVALLANTVTAVSVAIDASQILEATTSRRSIGITEHGLPGLVAHQQHPSIARPRSFPYEERKTRSQAPPVNKTEKFDIKCASEESDVSSNDLEDADDEDEDEDDDFDEEDEDEDDEEEEEEEEVDDEIVTLGDDEHQNASNAIVAQSSTLASQEEIATQRRTPTQNLIVDGGTNFEPASGDREQNTPEPVLTAVAATAAAAVDVNDFQPTLNQQMSLVGRHETTDKPDDQVMVTDVLYRPRNLVARPEAFPVQPPNVTQQPQLADLRRMMPAAPTCYSGLYAAAAAAAAPRVTAPVTNGPTPLLTSGQKPAGVILNSTLPATSMTPQGLQSRPALAVASDTTLRHFHLPGADFRPASFFTNQMTAFKAWLSVANEQRQTATQLPILLQVLLSQSHRTRALQLLSEFLDLGAWAVALFLTVGMLPYIVRLFNSDVPEVKPYLVFIWGKIIASASTDFGWNEAVRQSGYNYFTACLRDAASSLSPLVRTIAAFALTKMLDKDARGTPDAYFQEVYYKQNFIPIVIEQLQGVASETRSDLVRLRVWLVLALARLWCCNDEARWCGVRHGIHEVLYTYLQDPSPEVRTATVLALGSFINNYPANRLDVPHALELSQQVGAKLIAISSADASPLVRRELVSALSGLILQFKSELLEVAYQHWSCMPIIASTSSPVAHTLSISKPLPKHTSTVIAPVGSPSGAAGLLRGVAELGMSKLSRSLSRGQNFGTESLSITPTPNVPTPQPQSHPPPTFVRSFSSPKSMNIYSQLWSSLMRLVRDPAISVATPARTLLLYILQQDSMSIDETGALCINATVSGNSSMGSSPSDSRRQEDKSPTENNAAIGLCPSISSGLSHSVQFPNPRTHQTNAYLHQGLEAGEPQHQVRDLGNTSNDKFDTMVVNPTVGVDLNLIKTEFHAWSSVWFTQPLLAKYPDALLIRPGGAGNDSRQSDTKQDATASAQPLLTPQSLAALSTVSGDSQAVAFSNRITRLTKHLSIRNAGRFRWHNIAMETRGALSAASGTGPGSVDSKIPPELLFQDPLSDDIDASELKKHLSQAATCCRKPSDIPDPHPAQIVAFVGAHEIPDGNYSVGNRRSTTVSSENTLQQLQFFSAPANQCPLMARFHPYKPHLLVSDASGVSVWGIRRAERVQRLVAPTAPVTTPRGIIGSATSLAELIAHELCEEKRLAPGMILSNIRKRRGDGRITGLEIINSNEEQSLILIASEEGNLRVWKNYDGKKNSSPEMVSAWIGFGNLLQVNCPAAGVVTHWSDCSRQLSISGDVKSIRLWDTEHESRLRDIHTESETCVTQLGRSFDDRLIAAGFGDGTVRVYDVRAQLNDTLVFRGAVDLARIQDISLTECGRVYAVSSSGSLSAWKLSAGVSDDVQPEVNLTPSSNSSAGGMTSVTSSNSSFRTLPSSRRNSVARFFCDSIKRVSTTSQDSLLSVPFSGLGLNCAALHTNLPCPRSHLVATGQSGAFRQLTVTRMVDGKTIGVYRPSSLSVGGCMTVPTCTAFHPFQPMIAMGMSDCSVHLLQFRTHT